TSDAYSSCLDRVEAPQSFNASQCLSPYLRHAQGRRLLPEIYRPSWSPNDCQQLDEFDQER
ncbi:hypothetical protein G647_07524, partial [Cladophialophora carrionii CBS 160.54]